MSTEKKRTLFAGTELEIPWLKFKRNPLAMVCLWVLMLLYAGLLFQGFLAPQAANSLHKDKGWHPPHSIQFIKDGTFIGPYVHEYVQVGQIFNAYRTDKTKVHKLGLFVKGDEYQFLWFKADRHLFGTTDGSPLFLLGADEQGRDLLSRIIYGALVSLTIGFATVLLSLFGGILVGGISGMIGGFTDWFIMRACEIVILLPTFYLFLFLRSVMPDGMSPSEKFMIIMTIFAIPGFAGSARGIRNWVLSLKTTDYVTAATLAGVGRIRILFRHIVPQFRGFLILGITLAVPGVILGEAGLSFLNLGITEPSVSWGMLMSGSQDINVLRSHPWVLWPAAAIIGTVFCFFVTGFALKDALDPKVGLPPAAKRRTRHKEVDEPAPGFLKTANQEHQVDPSFAGFEADTAVSIRNLSVDFMLPTGRVRAVCSLDLDVKRGEILGLAGESGCGKSVTLQAMLAMVNPPGRIDPESRILVDGNDLLCLDEKELASIRGRLTGLIVQEPSSAFNPLSRLGNQIAETARVHRGQSKADAFAQAVQRLTDVRIARAEERAHDYPFQFSGGMLQRGMIALSMINGPRLLLADEPTTALDPTTQRQVLSLIAEERDKTGMAVVFVTHDLTMLSGFADRIAVMYAGYLVELAPAKVLDAQPRHPYSQDLLSAIPRFGQTKHDRPLYAIPGRVPTPAERPSGCPYHPRCRLAIKRCKTELPTLQELADNPGQIVRCHRNEETATSNSRTKNHKSTSGQDRI